MCILILLGFYSIYVGTIIIQKKKGIQTDQIAKGKNDTKLFAIELVMKVATYSVIVIEIVSIILNTNEFNDFFRSIGLIIFIFTIFNNNASLTDLARRKIPSFCFWRELLGLSKTGKQVFGQKVIIIFNIL